MAGLAWLAARALKLPRPIAGGFIIATALGNTGYIGYPITQALLGAEALPEAIFYDVFGTVGALVFVGLLVAQRFGDNDEARVNPLARARDVPRRDRACRRAAAAPGRRFRNWLAPGWDCLRTWWRRSSCSRSGCRCGSARSDALPDRWRR